MGASQVELLSAVWQEQRRQEQRRQEQRRVQQKRVGKGRPRYHKADDSPSFRTIEARSWKLSAFTSSLYSSKNEKSRKLGVDPAIKFIKLVAEISRGGIETESRRNSTPKLS